MHTATGYKRSVAIARYGKLRRRSASCEHLDAAHVRDALLHPFGGETGAMIVLVLLPGMSEKSTYQG